MSSAFKSCVTEAFEDDFREALNYIIHNEIEPEANDASGSIRNKLCYAGELVSRLNCTCTVIASR